MVQKNKHCCPNSWVPGICTFDSYWIESHFNETSLQRFWIIFVSLNLTKSISSNWTIFFSIFENVPKTYLTQNGWEYKVNHNNSNCLYCVSSAPFLVYYANQYNNTIRTVSVVSHSVIDCSILMNLMNRWFHINLCLTTVFTLLIN